MKTIYATTLNPESYEWDIYDIRENVGNEVIIDGEREFFDIDEMAYLEAIKGIIKEYDTYSYDCYYHGSIMAFLKDMLPKKVNGKRLSPKECNRIQNALKRDYSDEEIIITCLEVITGKRWKTKGLYGCCQGDWVRAYYPSDTSDEYIDYVEAWYFGTGTEVMVHEDDNTPHDGSEVSGWTFYTAHWKTEDIKAEIKRECYCTDDEEVEVKLWLYDSTRTIKIDQYKLAE